MIPFYSKRNQVYPVIWNGRGAVEKHFGNLGDWEREKALYRSLHLPHPDLLEVRRGVLVTAYCRFPTLLEELEAQEQSGFSAEPWEALALWLSECSRIQGVLPSEGNLRNFLWDAQNKAVLGIDFEGYRPGLLSDSAASLIAALLEYTPADTLVKRQAAKLLAARLSVPIEKIASVRNCLKNTRAGKRTPSFSGIILAGGRSSRMGCSKADLMLEGKSLLDWQIGKMRALGIQDILLSGTGGRYFSDARWIPDKFPDRGPLGGIHACLEAAHNPHCLIISVDTPLVPVSALLHLCRTHKNGVTILRHANGEEPLLGIYDRSAGNAIAELIKEHGAPVRKLREMVAWSVFDYAGPLELLKNCNSPSDYFGINDISKRYGAQHRLLSQ